MKYELWSIIPHDCVPEILHLKDKEEESNAKASGMVGKDSLFHASRRHGILAAERGRHHIIGNGTGVPTKSSDNEAAQKVDANVASQNAAIGLILENRMKMFHREECSSQGLFGYDQEEEEQKSSNKGTRFSWRLSGWRVEGLDVSHEQWVLLVSDTELSVTHNN